MKLKEKVLKIIAELSADEKQLLRDVLLDEGALDALADAPDSDVSESLDAEGAGDDVGVDVSEAEETAKTAEEEEVKVEAAEEIAEAVEGDTDSISDVTDPPEDESASEDVAEAVLEETTNGAEEIAAESNTVDTVASDADDELVFDKSVPAYEEDVGAPVIDDDGAEMPVDYRQIVDALTAKNAALEAENARLKAKTEGAFGYSMKPPGAVKVNSLYDEDVSDLKFRR